MSKKQINLIFPHQLFAKNPILKNDSPIYIIEEYLFFKQYAFHKQKIAYHRASMKSYVEYLKGITENSIIYIEAIDEKSSIENLIHHLSSKNIELINYIDPTDNWLTKKITNTCKKLSIETQVYDSPLFINTKKELSTFFSSNKKKFHQTTFYTQQRKKHNILIDSDGKPKGGKWTFDSENRKKYPAKKTPPSIQYPDNNSFYIEAISYTEKNFGKNLGELTSQSLYPTNFEDTKKWLNQFFEQRFIEFGPYEDAIVSTNSILNHSVLTPMLNIGLITPIEIIKACLKYIEANDIPINSAEGFIRQIIGWREFMRGMYEAKGSEQRTLNYWKFTRKIPQSFYNGTTGIEPIDTTIKKILQTGYCNHIERLMILGNFMMLCEFDPNEVYQWFMELFIDAYDWVMVPNIYGMSQFSDGGLLATKPYISGSNYIQKMSNYKKSTWQPIWDGLFWNFMDKHRNFFLSNPRLGMLVRMYDKMPEEKKQQHLTNGTNFINKLDI